MTKRVNFLGANKCTSYFENYEWYQESIILNSRVDTMNKLQKHI